MNQSGQKLCSMYPHPPNIQFGYAPFLFPKKIRYHELLTHVLHGVNLGQTPCHFLTNIHQSNERTCRRHHPGLQLLDHRYLQYDLGKVAFDTCIYFYKKNYNFINKYKFAHGKIFVLPNNIKLVACYHPSPRNVNTGRINEKKMSNLFNKVLNLI